MTDESLKLLFVHEAFAPDFRGGGEYVLLEAARALRARGHAVEVLCAGDPAQRSHDGIPTTRLARPRHLMNFAVPTVARHAHGADLVVAFTYNAAWAGILGARLAGRPCVLEVLGLFGREWIAMRGAMRGGARLCTERALMRAPVDRLVFLSGFSRDLGVALGAPAARSEIVSPGIDPHLFTIDAEKQDHVLFLGRVESRKGIGDVLEAARRLPAVPFRIVGWGDEIAVWRAQASGNVDFVAYERGEKAAAAFAAARIFTLPSRAETFGIAVVEAMAARCAVVSSIDLPFAGARVEAGDVDGLTAAIDRLWHDRDLCADAGARNREAARPFSWDAHAARLEEIFIDVVSRNRSS